MESVYSQWKLHTDFYVGNLLFQREKKKKKSNCQQVGKKKVNLCKNQQQKYYLSCVFFGYVYLSIRISFITLDINSVITLHRGSTYQGNSNFLQRLRHTGCHAILVNISCWLKTQGQMSIFTLCLWRTMNLKSFWYKTFSSSKTSSKLFSEIEIVMQLFLLLLYFVLYSMLAMLLW